MEVKSYKLSILFLVIAFGMIILSSPAVKADDEDPSAILQKEKIGSLKLDLPASGIIELLGKPGKKSAVTFEAATGLYVCDWEYKDKGIFLQMASEDNKGKMKVNSIRIAAPCKFQTARGIGIGSKKGDVEKAYKGCPVDKDFTTEDQLVIGSVFGGIFFIFKEGKVNGIFIGAGAE